MAFTNFKKQFGQNFLVCEDVAWDLIDSANITQKDTVLEIGPGEGVVTEKLLTLANKVVALELDPELIPILKKTFEIKNNLEIINTDALFYLQNEKIEANKIVASLPYQITSPLLHLLVGLRKEVEFTSLLIQKEVAEKICERDPDANYLSTFLNTFFKIELISYVDKECFNPVPEVDGAIITFKPIKNPLIAEEEVQKYSKFLHHGFLQQRKMLNKRFDKALLKSCEIDPTRRAETLSIEEWVRLFKATASK